MKMIPHDRTDLTEKQWFIIGNFPCDGDYWQAGKASGSRCRVGKTFASTYLFDYSRIKAILQVFAANDKASRVQMPFHKFQARSVMKMTSDLQ